MILAVDIGGTKTIAALFENTPSAGTGQPMHLTRWASQDFTISHITDYLNRIPLAEPVESAGFSLAGPIINEQCHLINLNKILDFQSIKQHLSPLNPIVFANDLVATAHSLMVLPSSAFISLTEQPLTITHTDSTSGTGTPPSGSFPIAILSLGTGLGQSVLLSEASALSSEGAHSDFAPNTGQQVRLWQFLQHRYGHVSYERVLSGPGLSNIYSFLTQDNPAGTGKSIHHPSLAPPDITAQALARTCPLCQAALELFLEILGSQAGNFALQTMSLGGVCLAGGIIPHILPALRRDTLRQAFLAKGRLGSVLSPIPIAAVNNDQAALWGAFRLASLALRNPA